MLWDRRSALKVIITYLVLLIRLRQLYTNAEDIIEIQI